MKLNLFDVLSIIVVAFWLFTYIKRPDVSSVAYEVFITQLNHWFTLFVILGGFSVLLDKINNLQKKG